MCQNSMVTCVIAPWDSHIIVKLLNLEIMHIITTEVYPLTGLDYWTHPDSKTLIRNGHFALIGNAKMLPCYFSGQKDT